jgi:hypothetical protein
MVVSDTQKFVTEVAWHLQWGDERRRQDQLDVLLMGGTVSEPIRLPDPDCGDCRGSGRLCACHGIEFVWSRRDHGASRSERCPCWKKPTKEKKQ